jgi:hypothetical protein
MIEKWAPFALSCFIAKVLKKRTIAHWTLHGYPTNGFLKNFLCK